MITTLPSGGEAGWLHEVNMPNTIIAKVRTPASCVIVISLIRRPGSLVLVRPEWGDFRFGPMNLWISAVSLCERLR
jgi:hypothetical protein